MYAPYQTLLDTSRRIAWRVEDIIGGDKRLDFSRPFLPESFARVEPLTFLAPHERLALNHIRAHGYLSMFELVETFILPFIDAHGCAPSDEAGRAEAYANFAHEEAKHIALFRRFREEFVGGFGCACPVIGPAEAIGRVILSHEPLAVAVLVLGIEWMSQSHYVESVKNDGALDPLFKSLLRHHWMEEAQHAKLDALLVRDLARTRSPEQIDAAIEGYLKMIAFFDDGLKQQTKLDLQALETRIDRELTAEQRAHFLAVQLAGQRWTMIGSAMRNVSFLSTLKDLSPTAQAAVIDTAPTYC